MEILAQYGHEDLALLYIGRTERGSLVEFVESVQPPIPREEKWVLIVSTLQGCPVRCRLCDAGGFYEGKLQASEILEQINALVLSRFPDGRIPVPKFKIQFARMGEPALNEAVLEVLEQLPEIYEAPGLMPCLSTVLPQSRARYFERLIDLKSSLYARGRFQLQFSLHTTDLNRRRELIPYPVLDFSAAARLGEAFYRPGDRKIGLNFAAAQGCEIDPSVLLAYFTPEIFAVKITPLNPTRRAQENGLQTAVNPKNGHGSESLCAGLHEAGYEVLLSLGEAEEDLIGSNCGQYLSHHRKHQEVLPV